MIWCKYVVCPVVLAAALTPAYAGSKDTKTDLRTANYPVGVYGAIDGASRFQDAQYANFFIHDGLTKADPKAIYALIQSAVETQENYKALYLARIFTTMKPELAAGWNNRATLANSLGLREEAAASAARMSDPTSTKPVPLSVLPGVGLKVKPKSLSDWAAAMALLGDSVTAQGGERYAIAVRDDICGLAMADPDEVKKSDADLIAAGLSPNGPYATAKPLNLSAIPPNLFVLKNAEPINYVTMKKMEMFGALAMAMASGYTNNAAGAQSAGQMAGDAMEVPSNYKGGSYDKGIYSDDGHALKLTKDHPKSSGKEYAVGSPLTLLWASGPSTYSSYYGLWDAKSKPLITSTPAGKPWDAKAKLSKKGVSTLYFPKLLTLCDPGCSNPVSMMEAMLTADDVAKVAPELSGKLVDLSHQRHSYEANAVTMGLGNAGNNFVVGFDESGEVYKILVPVSQPSGWLVETSR